MGHRRWPQIAKSALKSSAVIKKRVPLAPEALPGSALTSHLKKHLHGTVAVCASRRELVVRHEK